MNFYEPKVRFINYRIMSNTYYEKLLYNLIVEFLYFEGTECFCGHTLSDLSGIGCFACENAMNNYQNYEAKYLAFYEKTCSYYKLPTTLEKWWNLYGKEQVLVMRRKLYSPPTPLAPNKKMSRGCCPPTP